MEVIRLCRLCLTFSEYHANIFFDKIKDKELWRLVNSVCELNTFLYDGLPEHICVDCVDTLKNTLSFRNRAIEATSALKLMIQRNKDLVPAEEAIDIQEWQMPKEWKRESLDIEEYGIESELNTNRNIDNVDPGSASSKVVFENDDLLSHIGSPCMWRMIEFDVCKKNVRSAEAEIMRLLSQTRPVLSNEEFEEMKRSGRFVIKKCDNNETMKALTEANVVPQEKNPEKIAWTRASTLALLASYEAKNVDADKSSKNKTFWRSIAEDVRKRTSINWELTSDQVRWKFSALKRSYNRKVDHNRTSGNELKQLDEFDERIASILKISKGYGGDAGYSFNSPIGLPASKDGTEIQASSHAQAEPGTTSQMEVEPKTPESYMKRVYSHGTGSKTAKTKMELEKQWLLHLQMQREKQSERKEMEEREMAVKEEKLRLKKERLELRRRKLHLQSLNETNKAERHQERIAIEKEKCNLLKKLLNQRELMQ